MPYFSKARMHANCDGGILRFVCGLTGASIFSRRTGATGEIIRSTRGLRAVWSSDGESGTDGPLSGGFDV
jgi:hypothetical protein